MTYQFVNKEKLYVDIKTPSRWVKSPNCISFTSSICLRHFLGLKFRTSPNFKTDITARKNMEN